MRDIQVINNSVYYLCDPYYNGSSEIVARIEHAGHQNPAGSDQGENKSVFFLSDP